LIFFIAEYRAISRRPISVDKDSIYIRVGLFNVRNIKLENVESIQLNQQYVARAKSLKRYNLAGNPNIEMKLKKPDNGVERIYLGLDQPTQFIKQLNLK
jgi:hypothetical protein